MNLNTSQIKLLKNNEIKQKEEPIKYDSICSGTVTPITACTSDLIILLFVHIFPCVNVIFLQVQYHQMFHRYLSTENRYHISALMWNC